jgi:GntR family transcriptional regulator, histidine utilization repressor
MTPQRHIGPPAPAYRTVKQYVLAKVQSGAWASGDRVPSEHELVRQFHLSRMTVHRALRELTAEHVLTRVQGVGTFVAESRFQSTVVEIRSVADEIRSRQHVHTAEVMLVRVEKAGEAAARFALTRRATLFRSVIVHRENGLPVQLEDRLVNPAIAPGYLEQDFSRSTPSEYLLRVAPLERAEFTISATMPDAETRRRLAMRASEPCLVLHRTTWSGGVVASTATLTHPASRFSFTGQL